MIARTMHYFRNLLNLNGFMKEKWKNSIVKIRNRLPGGVAYERIASLKKIGLPKDRVYKVYMHYLRFIYMHGSKGKYPCSPRFLSKKRYENIYGLKIPAVTAEDLPIFWLEFADLVLPYELERLGLAYQFDIIDPLMDEGPYELNGNVSIKEGDVVVDCGTNIGLFSAIAMHKKATTLSFEPSQKVRKKYTNKTAKLNLGIRVCPYALGKKGGDAFQKQQSQYWWRPVRSLFRRRFCESRV